MPKPNGRKKISDERRDAEAKELFLKIRLTKNERQLIQKRMAELSIKRMSVYARLMLFDEKKDVFMDSNQELLLYHLNKIGNNINQMARQMNKNGAYKLQADEMAHVIELVKVLSAEVLKRNK